VYRDEHMLSERHRLVFRHPVCNLTCHTDLIAGSREQNHKRHRCRKCLNQKKRMHFFMAKEQCGNRQHLKRQQNSAHLLDGHRSCHRARYADQKIFLIQRRLFPRLCEHRVRKRHQRPDSAGKTPGIEDGTIHPDRRIADSHNVHEKIAAHCRCAGSDRFLTVSTNPCRLF
jgi:hypothetical protein